MSSVASHVVLIPIKPPARGKSRLGELGDDGRRALAEAFALDTVAAACATPSVARVLIATDDVDLARRIADLGAAAIPDGTSADLNATLRQTAAEAHRRWPALTPVALCADLPALVPHDLGLALEACREAVFVSDAERLGTTLYSAAYEDFSPRYGGASRGAHLDSGARELTGDLATLRRDVDDLADLRSAIDLGVGVHTTSALAHLRLP